MTSKSLLPLALTSVLVLNFTPPSLAQFHIPDQTYQRPTVIRKERVRVNECYQVVRQDFSVITYCKPDQFYLYLSDGGVLSVDEVQYNRNTIGQTVTQ